MALIVEVGILPVKARTRLVEAIAAAIRQIIEMETCVAAGIEEGINLNVYDPNVLKRFNRASGKANGALTAAETFRMWKDAVIALALTWLKYLFAAMSPGSKALFKVLL